MIRCIMFGKLVHLHTCTFQEGPTKLARPSSAKGSRRRREGEVLLQSDHCLQVWPFKFNEITV